MPQVILVNELDQETGSAEKLAAHEQALLHRAFSVFLWRKGELLLQTRAADKYHCPGLIANTCCSHPMPGEGTADAASRRLEEETGITRVPLLERFHFIYRAEFANGLTEYELDHVFTGEYNGPFAPNPAEIAELFWLSFPEILRGIDETPDRFAPWFAIAAPQVISLLQEKNQPQGGTTV